MSQAGALVTVADELRLFLRPAHRHGPVPVALDGTSSLGHVVESLGVPLTEVGLLRRRKLWLGAYVRGARPDDQIRDVLGRFAPPLAPWTRCPACNGPLSPVAKAAVDPLLRPGTRRTYQVFARCGSCGQVYWHGAHSKRLEAIIASAVRTVAASSATE